MPTARRADFEPLVRATTGVPDVPSVDTTRTRPTPILGAPVHGRPLATTLTAATLTMIAGGLPSAAHAEPPTQSTVVFTATLACQSDPHPFTFTLITRDRLHERRTPDRYHENSRSAGTFTAVPVHVDQQTGEVAPRTGSTWTGRMLLVHSANNGTAGAGHAVSTFRLHISGTSDTGEQLHQQELAHYTGTAMPDDDAAVVRRFFTKSSCR